MVSLFNGMGGACAALIALVEFPDALEHMHEHWNILFMSTILCGLVIGSTSFSGSMIATKAQWKPKKIYAYHFTI